MKVKCTSAINSVTLRSHDATLTQIKPMQWLRKKNDVEEDHDTHYVVLWLAKGMSQDKMMLSRVEIKPMISQLL